MMSGRYRSQRCLLLVALLLAAACAPAAAPSSPAAAPPAPAAAPDSPAARTNATAEPQPQAQQPQPPLRLRFAYTALSTTIAPYWIAMDAGLFREEGLEIEPTYVSASTVGMQSLIAREIDVVTATGGSALQAAANGADVVAFATNVNSFVAQMIVRPEITSPEQLRGQPLGVVRIGTVSEFIAKLLLRGWGMEAGRDVPIVQTGGQAETIGAMEGGSVRAAVVADVAALELRRLGYPMLADGADLNREYMGLASVGQRAWLDGNTETARRFVRGLARGMGRFVNDKEYSVQVMKKYTRLEDLGVLEGSWELHTRRYANRGLLTSEAALRTVQEEAADDERLRAFDLSKIIDNRLVEELHQSGFLERVYR